MFQLNLEKENQISLAIKMWKKCCLHSLSASLSCPTPSVLSLSQTSPPHPLCSGWIGRVLVGHFQLLCLGLWASLWFHYFLLQLQNSYSSLKTQLKCHLCW